ncbi:MAG: signal peptidase I [Clostridiales bacterium]|nr:signal peptidase I [Candidatus Crickella merdequi]
MKKQRSRNAKTKYTAQRLLMEVAAAAAVFVFIFTVLIGLSRVDGNSMSPTLENSRVVVYSRIGNSYKTGDVVAIRMPSGDRYVKRVIATEGDVVSLKDGVVNVNGKAIKETYARGETRPQAEWVKYPYTVNKDAVFVLGDNREVSVDSRTFGEVPTKNITGRIVGIN